MTRICSRCRQPKPLSDFYRFQYICKACRLIIAPAERARRKDRQKEYNQQYYETHKPALLEDNADFIRLQHARKLGAICTEHLVCEKIKKRAVYGMDMGLCHVKGPRCLGFIPFEQAQLDHRIPYTRGGKHCWYNVQTSCQPCNLWKYNSLVESN